MDEHRKTNKTHTDMFLINKVFHFLQNKCLKLKLFNLLKKRKLNSDFGNCIKTIFETRLIVIDSRTGQSEDCKHPRLLLKINCVVTCKLSILLICVFILLVLILDGFCSFNVSNESV